MLRRNVKKLRHTVCTCCSIWGYGMLKLALWMTKSWRWEQRTRSRNIDLLLAIHLTLNLEATSTEHHLVSGQRWNLKGSPRESTATNVNGSLWRLRPSRSWSELGAGTWLLMTLSRYTAMGTRINQRQRSSRWCMKPRKKIRILGSFMWQRVVLKITQSLQQSPDSIVRRPLRTLL